MASQVVAYHFCQLENSPTCAVPEFVHSLAAQLSQAPSLRPYYNMLMTNYELRTKLTLGYCLAKPDVALEEGVLEPLRSVQGIDGVGGSPCLVLIDGVCDSELHRPDRGDTIGSFLARHLDSFPSWIKFVVTVRSDRGSLPAVKGLPFHQISLDKSNVDERVRKDITDFIGLGLAQSQNLLANVTPTSGGSRSNATSNDGVSPHERFVQHLTDLSGGNFLYTKLTLELIERGHLVIKSGSFKVLPVSVSEVFLLELNLRFPTLSAFSKVSDILSVCLASVEPMTVTDVYRSVLALSAKANNMEWHDFVGRFNQLSGFLVRRGDDTVMFHHPLFREWLIRRAEAGDTGKYLCDPRRGHLGIALRTTRTTNRETPLSAEQTLEVAHHILKANIYRGRKRGRIQRSHRRRFTIIVAGHVQRRTLRSFGLPQERILPQRERLPLAAAVRRLARVRQRLPAQRPPHLALRRAGQRGDVGLDAAIPGRPGPNQQRRRHAAHVHGDEGSLGDRQTVGAGGGVGREDG